MRPTRVRRPSPRPEFTRVWKPRRPLANTKHTKKPIGSLLVIFVSVAPRPRGSYRTQPSYGIRQMIRSIVPLAAAWALAVAATAAQTPAPAPQLAETVFKNVQVLKG